MPDLPAIVLPHGSTDRHGQATAIEQSRAAAEVYASVLAAKQAPRDEQASLRAMEQVCHMHELADRAFYRFRRGGQQVTGPTVHLARELARCWGNIHYGVSELRRDDEHGQSEMQAFAWDLETNARASAIFIVPHRRDKSDGAGDSLVAARDVYENNANAGARRVREAVLAVLPLWFTERAKELCSQTLTDGGGKPLPQRIADAITRFSAVGVSEQQLVEKLGRPVRAWTEFDLAPLAVIYKSIHRGEVTKEDEFPSERVTAEELTRPAAAQASAEPPPAAEQPSDDARQVDALRDTVRKGCEELPQAKRRTLHAECEREGLPMKDGRLRYDALASNQCEFVLALLDTDLTPKK